MFYFISLPPHPKYFLEPFSHPQFCIRRDRQKAFKIRMSKLLTRLRIQIFEILSISNRFSLNNVSTHPVDFVFYVPDNSINEMLQNKLFQ